MGVDVPKRRSAMKGSRDPSSSDRKLSISLSVTSKEEESEESKSHSSVGDSDSDSDSGSNSDSDSDSDTKGTGNDASSSSCRFESDQDDGNSLTSISSPARQVKRTRITKVDGDDWVVMRVMATTDLFSSPPSPTKRRGAAANKPDDVQCCGELAPGAIVACKIWKSSSRRDAEPDTQTTPTVWVRVGSLDGSAKYAHVKNENMVPADRPDGREVQLYSILTRFEELTRVLTDLLVSKLDNNECAGLTES